MKTKGKVFISYRRETGSDLAGRICDRLKERGYHVFMDIEDLRNGLFGTALFEAIESSSDVIVILTPGSLDRCVNENDWVRAEIREAIKRNKNIIPVMARGFNFDGIAITLPEDISQLPLYSGIAASHELFDASMDRLMAMLVANRKAHKLKMALIGLLAVALVCAVIFMFGRPPEPPHTPPIVPIDPTPIIKEAGVDAGKLKKAEEGLDSYRRSSAGSAKILQAAEALFLNQTTACVSNELHNARLLIADWKALPDYSSWVQKTLSAESATVTSWWDAWTDAHFVLTNAQTVIADEVAAAQSEAAANISSSLAAESMNWSPDSWQTALEYYNKGIRVQKSKKIDKMWEAWNSFATFETNLHRVFLEASQHRGDYDTAKNSYQKISLWLSEKNIRTLLENAGETRKILEMENLAMTAGNEKNPRGTADYAGAIAFWPVVVGETVTNLMALGQKSLDGKQFDKGLDAVANIEILAENPGLSEGEKWIEWAHNFRQLIKAARILPPPATNLIVVNNLILRFQLVGDNIISDKKAKGVWILADVGQPLSLGESLDRELIEQEKAKYNASLPTVEQLSDLAALEKQHWPGGAILYLDPVFSTRIQGGGAWQFSKKCCTNKKGVFLDFATGKKLVTSGSEKGVLLLWKAGGN